MPSELLTNPPRTEAGFGSPERQNRWTVAFRLILAIPHLLFLVILNIVAVVLVVVGWFCALVIGRLPAGIASFLAGLVQYETQVFAYVHLMLDRYPPFDVTSTYGAPSGYPVNVDVGIGPVRRLAVLFRLFLLIPANIVLQLAVGGMGLISVVIWVIVLVAGRMPTSLFEAHAAVLRFQARYFAYAVMLTGKYPGELLGDSPTTPWARPATPPSITSPPPPYAPPAPPFPGPPAAFPGAPAGPDDWAMSRPSDVPPAPSYWAPPPAAPEATGVAAASMPVGPPPAIPPRTGRLVLSSAGKRIVVLFLVLGVLDWAGIIALQASQSSNLATFTSLDAAHRQLADSVNSFQTQTAGCAQSISCVESADGQLAGAFATFKSQVETLSLPASAQSAASTLEADTDALVNLLHQLSADSPTSYGADASRLAGLANQFDSDYQTLAQEVI